MDHCLDGTYTFSNSLIENVLLLLNDKKIMKNTIGSSPHLVGWNALIQSVNHESTEQTQTLSQSLETSTTSQKTPSLPDIKTARLDRARIMGKIFRDRKRECNQELQKLNTAINNDPVMQDNETQLAAYLLACTAINEPIDGDDFINLWRGNDTVEATREKLDKGRGNISLDIEKTNHDSSRRTQAGRLMRDKIFETISKTTAITTRTAGQVTTAINLYTRAGTCADNASVAAYLHAKNYAPTFSQGQTINYVSNKGIGHDWAEFRINGTKANSRDVILDAWGEGSAILRKHAAIATVEGKLIIFHSCDKNSSHAVIKGTENWIQQLQSNPQLTQYFNAKMKELTANGFTWEEKDQIWPPTSVLSRKFLNDARSALPKSEASFGAQLQAVGVARSLGENIKNAVKKAPAILDAAKSLTQ